ncbi:MAG: YggS family pyridoxal phosphate-dependent enzyme [Eggerthellaceae bacterium]|nr:YggS family pyridoxal phosphate-dependent enzyme [Eggerthellaceae bacterium]
MTTKERYERVRAELDEVCRRCGRAPEEVTLVAVSKTVGPDDVALAIEGGATDFGENRPDQLVPKADQFTQANWHFIGNIQSRRIKDIVGRAALVHSLFEESHARKIDECAARLGIVQDVLLEVNVSGELSKSGLEPDQVAEMLAVCESLPNVRVRGLMTMAPQGDADVARKTFADLRSLRDELASQLPSEKAACFTELSMGMSEDWCEAVEEGATIVRIGRAIFSESF